MAELPGRAESKVKILPFILEALWRRASQAPGLPLYILTGRRTFSAAEGFAYQLQHLKKAVVVGDTTRGGAHLTRSFSLGNGFVGFIPFARSENIITKTDWEGTGVIPDTGTAEHKSLLTAHNMILGNMQAAATRETEKRKIGWIINYNKAQHSGLIIPVATALQFTGQFAEFEVSLQEGQLMFRDTSQPQVLYKKMTAISSTLFQVAGDYQVEFIKDENNRYTKIRVSWSDGWEENIGSVK